jgi:serine phosphatase RsbU (regulator of sigma subunit)
LATENPAPARLSQVQLAVTLALMLVIVALLFSGGQYVRSIVRESFRDAELIRASRVHVADMLNEQLDEETAVRGYAAVRLPVLLAPYYEARARLPSSFARVDSDLHKLGARDAIARLRDAESMNRRWLQQVALPLILSKGAQPRLQLRGKSLMDRFRSDSSAIDGVLARQTAINGERAQSAVFLVETFAVAAALAVVFAAIIFTVQQYRLSMRLERDRATLEIARRRSAEARAAYQTEKRIADVLQEAFADRILPELPAATFSATYVPAIEQTKIGGDWYDALQLSQDRVLLAMGDVAGHGIDAVIAMNKTRQLLISYALLDAAPDRVLERVNMELVRGGSSLITAVCALVDTRTYEFSYATAGHPPPVLLEPGKRARLLEFGSLPLGVASGTSYETHRMRTVPGALIVLYTDGVIEHSRDLASGEALLLEAVESAAQTRTGDTAEAIRDMIFTTRRVADDVAILTVTLAGVRVKPEIPQGKLPAPASIAPRGIA